MSYQVNWEIQALDQMAGFSATIPLASRRSGIPSVSSLMSRGHRESFPYGSPDLRAGRYRVFYTIDENGR